MKILKNKTYQALKYKADRHDELFMAVGQLHQDCDSLSYTISEKSRVLTLDLSLKALVLGKKMCGKTHLIEHKLIPSLNRSYLVVLCNDEEYKFIPKKNKRILNDVISSMEFLGELNRLGFKKNKPLIILEQGLFPNAQDNFIQQLILNNFDFILVSNNEKRFSGFVLDSLNRIYNFGFPFSFKGKENITVFLDKSDF